jgi:hypothetical protein
LISDWERRIKGVSLCTSFTLFFIAYFSLFIGHCKVAFSSQCAILVSVNKGSSVESLRRALNSLGFGEFWEELFHPGSPLALLTAQSLRLTQPVLSAFTTDSGLAALMAMADRLDGPDTTAEVESNDD